MRKIGITGQSGFIGTHLYNFLKLQKEIEMIPFDKKMFLDKDSLTDFVSKCDTIVHLAALNRHNDPKIIYQTNTGLVQQLIDTMESVKALPQIIFSSSTQEEKDNLYGQSKKEGRELFSKWASKNNTIFSGLIVPNVFGPFGNPYYNSVIATFSHQLTHNEIPRIEIDGLLNLIYVDELVQKIYKIILDRTDNHELHVPPSRQMKVSELLKLLNEYKQQYFENHQFPEIRDRFELNLFNTFRSYIDNKSFFPVRLKKHEDNRGIFVETVKEMTGGQFSYSTTHPGITRGNHYHTRKIERFAVIKGKAMIELRRTGTDDVLRFELDGKNPAFVDMPVWYSHNITNIGEDELLTLFWINEFYDPEDPDTFFEQV